MKLSILEDENGKLYAPGLLNVKHALRVIKKKSPNSIYRLVDAGLVRQVWISEVRYLILKDLEKIRDNNTTPSNK